VLVRRCPQHRQREPVPVRGFVQAHAPEPLPAGRVLAPEPVAPHPPLPMTILETGTNRGSPCDVKVNSLR
jgi:hypothetical protein